MTGNAEPLISIFGPTAVGKTDVALRVADELSSQEVECVAVSADAYQLYRGLEVLSGAPSDEEQRRLRHVLVGSHGVNEEMSAGRYAREAHAAIDSASGAGILPIIVGGAGLYLQAALTGLEMRPPLTEEQQRSAELRFEGSATADLYRLLRDSDAVAAASIDPGDRYRIVRALSLLNAGLTPSPGDSFWQATLRRPALLFGLTREREELYARIDSRVEAMVEGGAAEEVARAADASSTARKIIGYDELPAGRIPEMKQRTRRYAKRQITWMRRIPDLEIIDLSRTTPSAAAKTIARTWVAFAE